MNEFDLNKTNLNKFELIWREITIKEMNQNQYDKYVEYWMDNDEGFSNLLESEEYMVEDIDIIENNVAPRTAIFMHPNMILLFPPFDLQMNYSEIT